ncbi:glycoside hydrolase family 3 N-terminal domain-containing protein [Bacillus sp. NTK034]|uniref:glycoside hydrolase family 3 N-terminal domain-containing protein n=1 Tax=Bacillus sp. NTK034 TaxID=2802176 RepID=UPI001A8C3E9B|nr:glycoside hydrolase family 3 N-terminal domain-containing protein [Bacillus sp. NTK034]MBN8202873.1 glycoside hydrolase family 3 C-terminal domain-containing protein [Bacillus sp. NTK034]
MVKARKVMFISLLAITLAVSQLWIAGTLKKASAESAAKDLIILQNVPEASTEIGGDTFRLKALHVFKEGHFVGVSDDVKWKSSNKNVAAVDQSGNITLMGKPGKTFISVTDGVYKDRIALQIKPDGKKGSKGKPAFKVKIIKEHGKQYDLISRAVKNMSIEEKVGQMLMPDFRTWKGKNVTEMLPEIEKLVKDYHLGGVILFRENVVTTEQTATLVSDYQKAADKFGLLMTIDQEGGIVTRLQSGTDMPGNMALGAARSEEISRKVGKAIGEELASLGINMNFAPVMDVNNNPDNPVIGVRSFGEDPQLVADMGVAYTQGLQSAGVAATAKHFPGHGDTAVDSHLGLPEVPHDKDRLKEVELYPFQKGMEAGIDAIMTAHVTFPKIDDTKAISKKTGEEIAVPATLSHKVLTELMREEMGYDGVITTDAMNMNAIAEHFGPVDAAIRAVKAGTDIVLMPVGLQEVAEGLLKAVENGEISEKRIDSSVERILTLKIKRGIIKEETPQPIDEKIANALEIVGSEEHKQIEKEAAERSVTLVKNDKDVLPLQLSSEDHIVVVGNTYIADLKNAISKFHANTTVIQTSSYALTEEQKQLIRNASAVIVGSYTFNVSGRSPDSAQMKMVNSIVAESEAPVIAVGIRNPYDIMAYPEVDAYIAQYGFRAASFDASAGVVFGQVNPSGKLPVTIPGTDGSVLYEFGHGLSY